MADPMHPMREPDAGPVHAFTSLFQAPTQMQHLMLWAPRMQAIMMRAAFTRQKEAAAFLMRRCDEDLKFADQIGKAESPKDIFAACAAYWQDAVAQYGLEAGQTMQRGSRGALDVVNELRSEASTSGQDAPLRHAA